MNALPQSATTGAIRASDFSQSTTDAFRFVWTAGKLRHVLAALGDHRVIVSKNGFVQVNVTLGGIRPTLRFHGYDVRIDYEYRPGETNRTWYSTRSVDDAIIVMPSGEAHRIPFDAQRRYHEESSAAIAAVRSGVDGDWWISKAGNACSWKAEPMFDYVYVQAWDPRVATVRGPEKTWNVPLWRCHRDPCDHGIDPQACEPCAEAHEERLAYS